MKNEDLVEEYPREYETTQFEKVLVSARRAKDIHRGHKQALVESERKPAYVALEEYNKNIIHLMYPEEEPPEAIAAGSEESEEEE